MFELMNELIAKDKCKADNSMSACDAFKVSGCSCGLDPVNPQEDTSTDLDY